MFLYHFFITLKIKESYVSPNFATKRQFDGEDAVIYLGYC